MAFRSILFIDDTSLAEIDALGEPGCLADLNLDQLIAAALAGREEYGLQGFFYRPLGERDAVVYRQEVFADLQDAAIAEPVERFAEGMREMRERSERSRKLRFALQKQVWFLEAIISYVEAVERFAGELGNASPRSAGLRSLRSFLREYAGSSAFGEIAGEARALQRQLGEIAYCITVNGNRVHVERYDGEVDYGAEVVASFAKFHQGAVKSYLQGFHEHLAMNHVEERVLELVAQLNGEAFAGLQACCVRHGDFPDPVLVRFDREVQFYLAYRDHMGRLGQTGLQFCLPQLSESSKEEDVTDTFDMTLAGKLVDEAQPVVCNDWQLQGKERIVVVSGPNQGGKTTFARTFGQLHYLACLGCPVPGSLARLMLAEHVFTHFERREDLSENRGKLEDDLHRVHEMLELASTRSVVVMNESFSSTALTDAIYLGERVLERLIDLDVLAVYVTFVDELASLDEVVVSATSTVQPDDPTVRTFKIVRKPADGRAYALAIAAKHGLTYEALKERIS